MNLIKILTISIIFFSISVSANPKGVPEEATFDKGINCYTLTERLDETTVRVRIWGVDGKIGSDTLERGDIHDTTTFVDGRWYMRKKYKFPKMSEYELLPPKERAEGVPLSAHFNFDLQKWEVGLILLGKKQGEFKLWWPTGEPAGTVEYKDGLYHGLLNMNYEKGQKYKIRNYLNGKIDGKTITYFDNGKIQESAEFFTGIIEGDRMVYEKNGNLKYKDSFKDGSIQQSETYENGKLKERKTFKDRKVIKTEKF